MKNTFWIILSGLLIGWFIVHPLIFPKKEVTEATITTDGVGRVTPANELLDSVNLKLDRIKVELMKMDSLNKEIDKQNRQIDSILNSM